jgi:hypothetical protein
MVENAFDKLISIFVSAISSHLIAQLSQIRLKLLFIFQHLLLMKSFDVCKRLHPRIYLIKVILNYGHFSHGNLCSTGPSPVLRTP